MNTLIEEVGVEKIRQKIGSHLDDLYKTTYSSHRLDRYRIKPKYSPLGITLQAWPPSFSKKRLKSLSGRIAAAKKD